MALFWRIWSAVTLVNLVVLTLFVGLAALQFGSINSGLVGERLAVLAERIAAPFEAAARDSAKAVGAFLTVIYGGLFSGSALGGLIAGRFGFTAARLAGAAPAVVSLLLGLASMRGRAGYRAASGHVGRSDQTMRRAGLRCATSCSCSGCRCR